MRTTWAGLFLVAAACTGTIDGGDDDGGGSGMNPPKDQVRVLVRDAYSPQANVRVIFQDASDVVLLDTMTDGAGTATADMTAGSVSVVRTYAPITPPPPNGQRQPEVYTYVGVKGGDLLTVANATSDAAPGAIVVKVPDASNGNVKVTTACGSGQGTPPNIAMTVTDCPAMVGFYVVDGDNSAFYKKMPYAGNEDLSQEALRGSLASELSATNVPANTQVSIEERVVDGTYTLFSSGEKRVDQNPAQVNLPNITGPDELMIAKVQTQGASPRMTAVRASYQSNPRPFDASLDALPSPAEPKLEAGNITWTESGTGTADAVLVMIDVTPNMSNATYTRWIVGPHAGLTLHVPVLPDPAYNPAMMDQVSVRHALVSAAGGFDAVRGLAFSAPNILDAATSRLSMSYSGNPPVRDGN